MGTVRLFQLNIALEHRIEFRLIKATFQGATFNIINFRADNKYVKSNITSIQSSSPSFVEGSKSRVKSLFHSFCVKCSHNSRFVLTLGRDEIIGEYADG